MTGVAHIGQVHPADNTGRRWAYFSCDCGVCGPPRGHSTEANADLLGHLRAVREARAAA